MWLHRHARHHRPYRPEDRPLAPSPEGCAFELALCYTMRGRFMKAKNSARFAARIVRSVGRQRRQRTGSTALHFTNAGGAGAITTGNGIQVVSAINGATTDPTAFTLDGEVRGGPYDYPLFRGDVGDPDPPNDWFLRSSFIPPPEEEAEEGEEEATPPPADQANDGLGAVSLGSTSGTTGRIGARGQWSIAGANGAIWQPYARANLWHGWDAGAQTTFARPPCR